MVWSHAAATAVDRIEAALDRVFGTAANPLRHLGALGFFLFWLIAASGVWLYVVYDATIDGAWPSMERMSSSTASTLARGIHRYASDAMVVVVLLHLLREFLLGRFRGARWFPWVTGVALIWLMYASGIGGYWLPMDRVAQASLQATAEWVDWLPLSGLAIIRNFVAGEQLGDRFVSLAVFLHIAVPLLLLLGMYLHVQRVIRADVSPVRLLAAGVLAMLAVLALAWPAPLAPALDFRVVASALPFDWFYLFPHPLMDRVGPGWLWGLAFLATALLAAVPWLLRGKSAAEPVARVSPQNCNGCGRCFADCPYGAVIVEPRTDGRRHAAGLARVLPDLCVSCGICAGACPSSTPFRSAAELVTGIDLPGRPLEGLRERLDAAIAGLGASPRIVLFGCDHAVPVGGFAAADTAAISLLCSAQLPPSFVEYALRSGADGVLVAGCAEGGCRFRSGDALLRQRLAGAREPHLRASVPPERIALAWAARHQSRVIAGELDALRRRVAALPPRGGATGRRAPKRREVPAAGPAAPVPMAARIDSSEAGHG
jgi:coenzyme F420-reducing hydrogenase delta subunit/ferredoxin